jgi:SAM-dependent methyltransferase
LTRLGSRTSYAEWVRRVKQDASGEDQAMELAAGGEFDVIGVLERELLIQFGLPRDGYVVDVGCGSGRLARPLSEYLTGRYLGTDVVPELVAYARRLVSKPNWRFEVVDGLTIPEEDGQADMVCFFSIFTHLLHEESYTYLREAKRVVRPGGKVIFSFLEFAIPLHWRIFSGMIDGAAAERPLNMFLSRDAITAWAAHLDLKIVTIEDGDKPHIPVPTPLTTESGLVIEGMSSLGQSVCVLSRG